MKTLPAVTVVGPSNSGKTRVATGLVKALAGRGYRVVAVKHCPHGHQVDRPATDSARLHASGAVRTILASPGRVTSIEETTTDATLEGVLAALDSSYDLVVAEGFKRSAVPKVLVIGAQELAPRPDNVIATVGEGAGSQVAPAYGFDQTDALAERIVAYWADMGQPLRPLA